MNQKPEEKYFQWDVVSFRKMKTTGKIIALFPKVPGCFNSKKDKEESITLAEFNCCGEDQQSFKWEDGNYRYIFKNSFPAKRTEFSECLKVLQKEFRNTTIRSISKPSKPMKQSRRAAMKGHL